MPNPDGTIDVRVVLYVKVDPKLWSETMMDRPTTKINVIKDSVKEWVRDVVDRQQVGTSSRNSELDGVPVSGAWLGVGQ